MEDGLMNDDFEMRYYEIKESDLVSVMISTDISMMRRGSSPASYGINMMMLKPDSKMSMEN